MPASTSAASSDPVAAKSAFLCAYMSNHSDTLVAYILHELQSRSNRSKSSNGGSPAALHARDVLEPKMASIDSRKMELSYRDAQDNRKPKTVEVEFDPPLAGYEEVRPRLLQMKMQAESSIGMVGSEHPSLSHRTDAKPVPPADLPSPSRSARQYRRTACQRGEIPLSCCACSPSGSAARLRRKSEAPSAGCAIWQAGGGLSGRRACSWWVWSRSALLRTTTEIYQPLPQVAVHAAEAAFQFRSCQKYGVPLPQTLLWAVTTFFLGFASLLEFRKVVREARIASVDKTK